MPIKNYIIDCDTGRDDALSIFSAIKLGISLVGIISSYGNVSLDQVTENCARVCAFAGRPDIKIIKGSSGPSRMSAGYESIVIPRQNKSGNGLCNIELPAILMPPNNESLETAFENICNQNGPVDYIILGPATNFARLCEAFGPKIHEYVRSVFMMGGKLDPLWQSMPGADFNILCDPYSLKKIMESGIKTNFVPMNFTWPILLDLNQLESLKESNEISRLSKQLMIAHAKHFAPEPVFRFHDPCVIFAAKNEQNFRPASISIDLNDGATFARLYEDDRGYPCAIFEGNDEIREQYLNDILQAIGLSR